MAVSPDDEVPAPPRLTLRAVSLHRSPFGRPVAKLTLSLGYAAAVELRVMSQSGAVLGSCSKARLGVGRNIVRVPLKRASGGVAELRIAVLDDLGDEYLVTRDVRLPARRRQRDD